MYIQLYKKIEKMEEYVLTKFEQKYIVVLGLLNITKNIIVYMNKLSKIT